MFALPLSVIKLLTGWVLRPLLCRAGSLPPSVIKLLTGWIFDFLKKAGEDLAGDVATKREIEHAIESAANRFSNEYEDKNLARALVTDTRFYDLESIRNAVNELLKHPFDPAPQVKIEKEFEMVLPEGLRGSSGKAAQEYLELLHQQLMGIEKLKSTLDQVFQYRTMKASERSAKALEEIAKRLPPKERTPDLKKARDIYLRKFIDIYSPKSSSPIGLGTYEDLPLMPFFSPSSTSSGYLQMPKRYSRLSEIYDLPKTFVLSGPHGSGKTTLLRKKALENAEQALEDMDEPLPILIEAWEWRSGDFFTVLANNLRKYLFSAAKLLSPAVDPNDLISQGVRLYFDGLDELNQEKFLGLTNIIRDLDTTAIATYRVDDYEDRVSINNFPEIAILPLEMEDIRRFAKAYLSQEKGRVFINEFESLYEGREKLEEKALIQLAQIPFFLNIILDSYKERGGLRVTNQWVLLEDCVNRLLKGFDERLGIDRSEIKPYRNASVIISLLSELAFKNIHQRFIPTEKIPSDIPKALIEALAEVGLIIINSAGIRFRHEIITEFFAAHQFINANLESVVRKQLSGRVLLLLASYDEVYRKEIQRAILKIFDEDVSAGKDRDGANWARDRIMNDRGLVWLLGEIGDIDSARWLLAYASKRESSIDTNLLASLAKIVGRLPDEQEEKGNAVELIGERILEKPLGLTRDRFLRGDPISKQIGAASNYIDIAKALAKIRTDKSAEFLVEGFYQFIYLFQKGMSPGQLDVFRRDFSLAFSKMGKLAVPYLFKFINDRNDEIAITAGEALAWTLASVEPKRCFPILARHPLPEVRLQVALALGEQLNPESIPYLINALDDDGIVQRGSAGHHGGMGTVYFYVRNVAAIALAKFDSAKARTALLQHGYSENGELTLDTLIERLDENIGEPVAATLSRQWARNVAGVKGGLDLLLPRLGHMEHAPVLPCPIADALRERMRIGEKPVESLLNYFNEANDFISQMETILLVGEMGDRGSSYELLKIISSELDEDLRAAAAGGLAILVARRIISFSEEEIINFENAVALAIDLNGIDGGKSLGRGLGRVAFAILSGNLYRHPLDIMPKRNIDISAKRLVIFGVGKAIERVEKGSVSGVKVGLKILDEVIGALTNDIVSESSYVREVLESELAEKALAIIESDPCYQIRCALNALIKINYKRGSFDLVPERGPGNFPVREYYIQEASKAFKLLKKAREIKLERQPKWARHFESSDWDELGCDDGIIYFLMGHAARCLKQNSEASQYWTSCIDYYKVKENPSQDERRKLVRVLLDLADLLDNDRERAYKYAEQAVADAQKSKNSSLHFEALGKLVGICMERKDWARTVEASNVAVNIAVKIPHSFKEILKPLSTRALAYLETNNYPAALIDYQEGFNIAEKYGLLEKSIEFRVGIIVAHSHVVASEEFADDLHLQAIVRFYDDIQDWIGGARAMIFIADRARLGLKEQYIIYSMAKECAEKMGPTIDAIQIMSDVMPKLTEIWRKCGGK